jgi:hypothetical protein
VTVRRPLGAILLAVVVACGGSPPPYQERTLPSGQTVKILGIGKMFFSKGDSALMLKYQTDLNLDDEPALHREVLAMWEVFRHDAEGAGLKAAIVSANERPVSHIFWSSNRSFNFVFEQVADGTWREAEGKASPTPNTGGST